MTKTFGNFTDLMDFSRASTATFLGSDGLIQTAAADTPRIEYATDGTVKGLLIEEARTNLLTYSEDFSNAAWGKVNSSLSTNVTTAPDGTTTADKLIANTSLLQHRLDQTPTSAAGDQTLSVYVKDAGYGFAWLRIGSSGAMFSIADGTITNIVTGVTASSQDVGNGWRFLSISYSASANDIARINVIETQNGSDFAGDGTSGIYVWGAQLEVGSFATSYIPTSGATATRSADIASINVENFGYNQNEGTVVVEFDSQYASSGGQIISELGDGASTNQRIRVYMSGASIRSNAIIDGTNVAFFNLRDVSSPIASGKVAFAFSDNDFASCIDGGTILTDTSGVISSPSTPIATLKLGGFSASSSENMNGHIRDFQYYPRRLTNRQLQELTGATNNYDYTTVEAGTITRSPVATGSDLVAYSGFSATNYLEQPYNSDLDFGTGDFCVMGWSNQPASGAFRYLITRDSVVTAERFFIAVNTGSEVRGIINDNITPTVLQGSAKFDGTWKYVAMIRKSGTAYLYVNGALQASSASTQNITNTSAKLFLGIPATLDGNASTSGSLALLRISATAPSAEQIAKIYEDEKVLFQEGAQATLYGSSDAVTALAHDDTTNLLHVGTSAGRSVFQGLRRVENTTDAVGTAISASNGLVVEE